MSMLMAGLMLAQTPAMALAAEMPQEIVDEAELILEEEAGAEETASVEAAATETLSVEGIEEVASETDYPESEETEIADSTWNLAADETQTPEQAAQEYLRKNFIDGENKIITNGGAGIVKSEDGLSYEVGRKIPGSGSKITTIAFRFRNDVYQTAWYISENPYVAKKGPTVRSRSITRPSAEEGDYSFTATLKLFDKATNKEEINAGTATALAEQEFTIRIVAEEPDYYMSIVVQSEDGTPITDATVTLEKGRSAVKAESDGSYKMESGESYTLKVKKDGYNDYTESAFTFTGNPEKTRTEKQITLTPIVLRTIRFEVKDKATKAPIANPTIQVKQGYYTTVKPEEDGSYRLNDGTAYNYTVEGTNYKTVNGSLTPSKDEVITVELEKDIRTYFVRFQAMDGEQAVANATCKVEREEEDDWTGDTEWVEVKANADGAYELSKFETYRYTIKAEGYEDVVTNYTPSGSEETIAVPVAMSKAAGAIDPKDQATVDEAVKQFDNELGALFAQYGNATIADLMKKKFEDPSGGYTKLDKIDQVKVTVKATDKPETIGTDGVIHYVASDTIPQYGINSVNVSVELQFELNGAKAVTKSRSVMVGWDQKHFETKMQEEAKALDWDKIKGSNVSADEVTENLNLVRCMGSSAQQVWSEIEWTSSDESIIRFEKPSIDSMIYPMTGVVTRPAKDTKVTLTATFKANGIILNSRLEKVEDFETVTKTFEVLVKGEPKTVLTEKELLALLDTYYTADRITDSVTKEVADLANCKGDLQLPRYTRIKDEKDEFVFNNKEITVTTDNPAITISGYRAAVDRFSKELTGDLIVTFTRDGVTAVKRIPVTVAELTEAELEKDLDAELAMMEQAKLHYFDGINDGQYADKDSVTGNLHAFSEMVLDENKKPVWIYAVNQKKGNGIIADDYQKDPWIMEGLGYNKFKSSNPNVIAHENLLVTRQKTDTQVTITSWLSSERYGRFAEKYPENEKLQKLYHQEISVTVTVLGTQVPQEALQEVTDEAQKLADGMTEGSAPGAYPEGTRAALQEAITKAQDVLKNPDATEQEVRTAIRELKDALEHAKAAQNAKTANVTVRMNEENGTPSAAYRITVKADDATAYGYKKPEALKNEVTAADALYAAHAKRYGDAFAKDPSHYLVINSKGMISTLYGKKTSNLGYAVNNKWVATGANETVLADGDTFSIFLYNDPSYTDRYFYFSELPSKAQSGADFTVKVRSYGYDESWNTVDQAENGSTVVLKNTTTGERTEAVTDETGTAVLRAPSAGTYQLYVDKTPYAYFIAPMEELQIEQGAEPVPTPTPEHTHAWSGVITTPATCTTNGVKTYTCSGCKETKTEVIPAMGHSFGAWTTSSPATVFAPEQQERSCAVCGTKETRTGEGLLTPTIQVNAQKLLLKVKQKTTAFKVTGLAAGDSVVSYTSSNTKVFTVSKNGALTAGKKPGKATLTITLASGLEKKIPVTVQKGTVTTTKITGLKKKVTLEKGKKLTLKPALTPITSQQKFTYTSSNKKVATVSKKGVITAKKSGTAKITVKSGKKKFVVTVTVPKTKTEKITGVPETISLKKGKTYTLKAKRSPKGSDEKLTYSSSNKKIATVSKNGKIKGVKKGTVTITVKSGKVTVKCKVTVK